MNRKTTFNEKLESGWTPDDLRKYYVLTEEQFEKVLKSLEEIHARVKKSAKGSA